MDLILLDVSDLEILDLNGLNEYNHQLMNEVEKFEREYQCYKNYHPYKNNSLPIDEQYPLISKLRNFDNLILNKIAKYKFLSLSTKKIKLEKYIEKYEEYLKLFLKTNI